MTNTAQAQVPQQGEMSSASPVRSRRNRILAELFQQAVLIIFGIAFMLPFAWMVSSSLKTDGEIFRLPVTLIPDQLQFSNYVEAVQAIDFFNYLGNSFEYALWGTVGAVVSNVFIAYGFARVRWPGRDIVFIVVISTMMLPFQVRMIPLYVFFAKLGWLNSLLPLIVPIFFGNAFYIFMLRQFMITLPAELDDAARIDGCNELGIFWRIVLPLSKPAIITVAIFELLHTWNDFLGPLIYLRDPDSYTLAIGLQLYFTQYGAEWALLMAAATMFTLPMVIVFFVAQRTFIEGIALTGIKG
ncbi:MAG: carbohydrate ABC transporter permease [Chloroflexota bacterium]